MSYLLEEEIDGIKPEYSKIQHCRVNNINMMLDLNFLEKIIIILKTNHKR